MTYVPPSTRFIGFSELANLSENKTANLNAISQPFTMQDIADASGNFEAIDPFYNNPEIKSKMITQNGVFSGILNENGVSSPFFELNLDEFNSFIMQYSLFGNSPGSKTGNCVYTARSISDTTFADYGLGLPGNFDYSPGLGDRVNNIQPLVIYGPDSGIAVEIIYSIKLFRIPMFYD